MKAIARVFVLLGCTFLPPGIVVADEAAEGESWTERIDLSGDLRLRYEEIRQETQPKRDRFRYRARLALVAEINDKVEVVLELASSADNPVSRNVTFDDGFSSDDIGFDLAYVDWTPLDGMHVYAGKIKNPLFRAGGVPLVWDSDLNPEGIALTFSRGMLFGNAGYFQVEERGTEENSILTAAQLGTSISIGEKSKLTAGVGFFAYSNTIGNVPFYNGAPKGNTVDLPGNYVYEYEDTEFFAELRTQIGNLPFSVFAHGARNNKVDEQDAGIGYGIKLGSAKNKGQWEFGWVYEDIEADALIGTFNDSDFGGGGTDVTGHIIKAKYVVSKNIILGGTYFKNRINPYSLPEEDYDRLQLDVEFKFE